MQGISPPLVVSFLFLRTTALLFPLSPSHDKFTFSFSLHHLPLSLFLCLVSVWKITTPPSPISKARLSRRFHVMLCYVLLQFLHAWSPMDDWTTVYVLISFSSAKPPQSPHFIGSDLLVDCFWRIIALSMARLWFYLFFFREGNIISFFCVCDAFSLFITNSLISRLFVKSYIILYHWQLHICDGLLVLDQSSSFFHCMLLCKKNLNLVSIMVLVRSAYEPCETIHYDIRYNSRVFNLVYFEEMFAYF